MQDSLHCLDLQPQRSSSCFQSHPPLIWGQLSNRGARLTPWFILQQILPAQSSQLVSAPGRSCDSRLGFVQSPNAGTAEPTKTQAERDGFMTISLKITPEWEQLKPGFQTSGPSYLSKANTATLRNRNKNYFLDLLWPRACKNEKLAGFLNLPHFPGSKVLLTSLSVRFFRLYFQRKPQPEMRFVSPSSGFPRWGAQPQPEAALPGWLWPRKAKHSSPKKLFPFSRAAPQLFQHLSPGKASTLL